MEAIEVEDSLRFIVRMRDVWCVGATAREAQGSCCSSRQRDGG
jgi:hypothetical protein